jgi:hypothetical protein
MSGRRLATVSWLGALLYVSACGSDEIVQPDPVSEEMPPEAKVTVSVTIASDTLSPGDTLEVLVRVGGVTYADSLLIDIDGPWAGSADLPVEANLGVWFALPREDRSGPLTVSAIVLSQWERVTDADSVFILDRRAPTIHITTDKNSVLPGDSLHMRLEAADNAALCYTTLRVAGAVTASDSIHVGGSSPDVVRETFLHVPGASAIGDSLTFEAVAGDCHSFADTVSGFVIPVYDTGLPSLSGTMQVLGYPHEPGGRPQIVPGDSLTLQVNSSDDWQLDWIGFSWSNLGITDSVPVSGKLDSASFAIQVPSTLSSCDWCRAEIFAWDSVGNRRIEQIEVSFLDGVRRPYRLVDERIFSNISDYVADTTRDLVFLAMEGRSRVAVLSLTDASFRDDLLLPSPAAGLDLTTSGDSLIVAVAGGPQLAVVDLTAAEWNATTLELTDFEYPGYAPAGVRIASNNKAFVALQPGYRGYFVDLASGTQGFLPGVEYGSYVVRSGDRSIVMLIATGHTSLVTIYHSDSDSFEQPFWANADGISLIDETGSYVYNDGGLLDLHFNPIDEIDWEDFRYCRPDFSADGALFACIPGNAGYRKVSLPDGELLEQVAVPYNPTRFWATPDGRHLLVFAYDATGGSNTLKLVVDLEDTVP